MHWFRYGRQVSGSPQGAAVLVNTAYDDQLKAGASLLLRFAMETAHLHGVTLTGAVWRKAAGGIEELTLETGARRIRAEFVGELVASFPARNAEGVRRVIRALIEQLAAARSAANAAPPQSDRPQRFACS